MQSEPRPLPSDQGFTADGSFSGLRRRRCAGDRDRHEPQGDKRGEVKGLMIATRTSTDASSRRTLARSSREAALDQVRDAAANSASSPRVTRRRIREDLAVSAVMSAAIRLLRWKITEGKRLRQLRELTFRSRSPTPCSRAHELIDE